MRAEKEFIELSADLVSLASYEPFLHRLFALPAGRWLALHSACADLPSIVSRITPLEQAYKTKLYATWLLPPEVEGNEHDCAVVMFYSDTLYLSYAAIYNKARLHTAQAVDDHQV